MVAVFTPLVRWILNHVNLSRAGIACATQVSKQWLQTYVNEKYAQVSRVVQVVPKKGHLTIQCDELGSSVDHKGNK
jgi:hypothetical protein